MGQALVTVRRKCGQQRSAERGVGNVQKGEERDKSRRGRDKGSQCLQQSLRTPCTRAEMQAMKLLSMQDVDREVSGLLEIVSASGLVSL